MEKLKKLSLNKRYVNKTNKDYFLKIIKDNKFDCKVKQIENDQITFLSNKMISDEKVMSLDRYKYYLKHVLLKHWSGIITIILVFIILFTSSKFIRVIEFKNPNDYRAEIYNDVLDHLVQKGPFYVLDDSLNNISQELRNNYPEYAWVGLTLNSSKIIIDLQKQEVPKKEVEDLTVTGDLVATQDAVISDIVVSRGVVMVMKNQSVKKGDLLVSGNMKILINENDHSNLVKSKGIIIGNTINLEKIKVPIETEELVYSGKIKRHKVVSLFGNMLGKNYQTFENYYTDIKVLFNLFKILEINEITYYEQVVIKKVYTRDTAINYAESKVRKEFEINRTSELEKIDNIELLEVTKEGNYYIVSLIVKKHQNIASFRQH